MWRKTFDSIGKPLPKRKNIVLTKNKNRNAPWVEVIHDVSLLTHVYEDSKEELCVIWWEQIYKLFLPYASILHLTHIHKEVDGDTFFPHYSEWFLETARVKMWEFDFITYERSASQEKYYFLLIFDSWKTLQTSSLRLES